MRLTYLAHASFLVEAGGVRLVTDPWLDGPTYLSAWWQFPAPALSGRDLRGVDYVYITHEHADHLHEPTLRQLPSSTPILIGKFISPRVRQRLQAVGFTDVRELPHGREVALSPGLRVTSYQYRADDTALVLKDDEATVFNLNDCLLRGDALSQVLDRYPRVDLLAMSFANAEAYPIVYDFEDPHERVDWDDRSRFDAFLDKVRAVNPEAFVPFASMFCFLSDRLFPINDRIVSPGGLIDRAMAGEVRARALPMNPGDLWTPGGGHEIRNPIDWTRKAEILREYAAKHADEVRRLAAAEVVPGGSGALQSAFRAFFRGFADRIPPPLRSRLELRVRWDVKGPSGGVFWSRFSRGKVDLTPPGQDDQWDVRLQLDDWPLWRVVTRVDQWQTLGISCRFFASLRRGMRDREVFFWFLLYLDDMGYLAPWRLLGPRAAGVLLRRRRELLEHTRALLGNRFVESSLRGKFSA